AFRAVARNEVDVTKRALCVSLLRQVEKPPRNLLTPKSLAHDFFEVVSPLMLLRQFLQAFRPSQVSRDRLSAGGDRGERVIDFMRDARCQLADASQAARASELLLHFRDAGNLVHSHYCER